MIIADPAGDEFIGSALQFYGKRHTLEVIEQFRTSFQRDLTALFDAIRHWEPDTPIGPELADEYLAKRIESDSDFDVPGFARNQALACFLAVAAFWQFEMSLDRRFLGRILGELLPWNWHRPAAKLAA